MQILFVVLSHIALTAAAPFPQPQDSPAGSIFVSSPPSSPVRPSAAPVLSQTSPSIAAASPTPSVSVPPTAPQVQPQQPQPHTAAPPPVPELSDCTTAMTTIQRLNSPTMTLCVQNACKATTPAGAIELLSGCSSQYTAALASNGGRLPPNW